MVSFLVTITEETNDKLKEIKKECGQSKKETIRRALEEYLKKKK